jgi:hypothetical protein
MRRMVDVRPAEPVGATLHPIDGGLEAVSARAV